MRLAAHRHFPVHGGLRALFRARILHACRARLPACADADADRALPAQARRAGPSSRRRCWSFCRSAASPRLAICSAARSSSSSPMRRRSAGSVTERLAELRRPFEQMHADIAADRAADRRVAGARRSEGRRGAAGHPVASGRQPPVGRHLDRDHLRAVAVPARLGHDVLRKDHPVLRQPQRKEAGAARRLRRRARDLALSAHRRR